MTERRPFAHNSTLRSGGPLPRVNKERRARRESDDLVYGTHHAWIKRQPCELMDHPLHACDFYADRPCIEGHHLKHVGNGGEDRSNEIPCCPALHDEFHALGSVSKACEHFGRDFRSVAVEYTASFDRETAGQDE